MLWNQNYGRLPLAFEPNRGQADSTVQCLCRGKGFGVYWGQAANTLVLWREKPPEKNNLARPHAHSLAGVDVIRMALKNADPSAAPAFREADLLPGKSNYLIGRDKTRWRTGIPHYSRMSVPGLYPGVDLAYYGNPLDGAQDGKQGKLEYDFAVSPGANPGVLQWEISGAQSLGLEGNGDLALLTKGGQVLLKAPSGYQMIRGERQAVPVSYLVSGNTVGFKVGNYDRAQTLVIDPVLDYSTYLGGSSGDESYGVAVDAAGDAYSTGYSYSTNFPTTSGAYQTFLNGPTAQNAFVTKLDPTGALVYSTYVGGSGADQGNGIALDSAGNAYVAGETTSSNFPTVLPVQGAFAGNVDACAFILNASGDNLLYSTYWGGNNETYGFGLALDASDNIFVVGSTSSNNLPTAGAYQAALAGTYNAFVLKLKAGGNPVLLSTYLGGENEDTALGVAVDPSDSAYVVGTTDSPNFPTTPGSFQTVLGGGGGGFLAGNAFITKFNPAGNALVYSTFLGGTGGTGDVVASIVLDSSLNAFLAGTAGDANFPVTPGAFQTVKGPSAAGLLAELNPSGSSLVYSTFIGGSEVSECHGLALDYADDAYFIGETQSPNFPTVNAFQSGLNGGTQEVVVGEMNPAGNALLFSTYLGNAIENGYGIALDGSYNIYISGQTWSGGFPTVNAFQPNFGGGNEDAFMAKISSSVNTPTPSATPTATFSPTPSSTPAATPSPTFTPTPPCAFHAWPNPFNPRYAVNQTLKFGCLPAGAAVDIYNLSGEWVAEVAESGGIAQWTGTNSLQAPCAPGIYFYAVKNAEPPIQGKFLLVR